MWEVPNVAADQEAYAASAQVMAVAVSWPGLEEDDSTFADHPHAMKTGLEDEARACAQVRGMAHVGALHESEGAQSVSAPGCRIDEGWWSPSEGHTRLELMRSSGIAWDLF